MFDQPASTEETSLLRQVATSYGYSAFVAVLVRARQYEERRGRGLVPVGGLPIAEVLQP